MRKIILWILMVLLIQSCGFQSRKYTTGYYANFSREVETSAHPIVKTALSADKNDSTKFFHSNQSSPIVSTKTFQFEHSPSLKTTSTSLEELQSSELTIQKNNTSQVDTLKLRFDHKKKDKSELKPPHDILKLRNKRRVDALLSVLSFVAAILFLLAAEYNSDAFWGLLGTSLINIWMVFRMHRDFRQMKKLMRSIFCENQDKKWFLRQEKRNNLAVVFTPFYLAMLILSLMLFTIGIFIGFSLF